MSFKECFSRLETLEREPRTRFERIEGLLDFHLRFVEEMPDETTIGVSTSPAKLKDPEHICTKNVQRQRERLKAYLNDCLEEGIKCGEFNRVPVPGRVNFLIAMINEVLRYRDISFTSASLITAACGSVMAAFDDYIRHGGFPEVVMANSEAERRKLLQSYFKTIFYRDILERYNVKARYVLDALMKVDAWNDEEVC
jgi:hypothetical protein